MMLVPLVFLALAGCSILARSGLSYEYYDNVREYMASALAELKRKRLAEARMDLENVTLIDPTCRKAWRLLFKVYLAMGAPEEAAALISRVERLGVLDDEELDGLRRRLAELRERMREGRADASAPAGTPSTSASAETTSGGAPYGNVRQQALSMVMKEAEAGEDRRQRVSPMSLPPRRRWEEAMRLYRAGDTARAAVFYVSAVQEEPALLAEKDEGLFDAVVAHYETRSARHPDDPKPSFILGYLYELHSEYEKSLEAYRKAARASAADSRLRRTCELKIQQLSVLAEAQKRLAREAEGAADVDERERLKRIAAGEHPKFTKASEFYEQARRMYEEWNPSDGMEKLDEIEAYLKGALSLDPDNPHYYYILALVAADRASAGREGAREQAVEWLDKALAHGPSEELRRKIASLRESLSE